jgi:hypothetical protein
MSLVCQTATTYNTTVSKSVEKRHLRPYTRFVPSNFLSRAVPHGDHGSSRVSEPADHLPSCSNVFFVRKRGGVFFLEETGIVVARVFCFGLSCVEWPIAEFC